MLKLCAFFLLFTHVHCGAQIRFEDVTEKAGLIGPLKGIMGHGGAFGDVDGNGLPDLYVGGFADRPDGEYEPAEGAMPNVLLRNLGGLKFEVNFTDYLDTGLFLDHRLTRLRLCELARGKRFLNLFCYTATASVHAAAGGALGVTRGADAGEARGAGRGARGRRRWRDGH